MITIIPLKAEHVQRLKDMGHLTYLTPHVNLPNMRKLESNRWSFSAVDDTGEIQAVGGVIEIWGSRGEAWMFFNSNAGPYLTAIFKGTVRFLDLCPLERIEAVVDLDFERGHRYIKALGFKLEAPLMRKYGVTGLDGSLYSFIKG